MLRAIKYANVSPKVGAERSKLLNEAKIKALIGARTLPDFATQLKETAYEEEVARILLPYNTQKFDRVFQENLIENYIKIVKNSPRTVTPLLKMYIQRFEVENLKAIIKSIYARLGTAEKRSRIYFQVEDFLKRRSIFEEASKAADIKQLADILRKTEYGSALKQGLVSYEENGTTACFDVLLDKIFFEKLHNCFLKLTQKEQHYAKYYESIEEDRYVLLTLLRAKNLRYDANWLRVIVPQENLNISKKMIEALLAAESFDSALSVVLKSPFGKFFTKAQTPEETIATGEKAFRKAIYLYAVKNKVAGVFNVSLPLAFMIQKDVEVRNLNSICLGVEAGMSSEKIQSILFYSS